MTTQIDTIQPSVSTTRLEPMLVRLPPALAHELRNLARKTRVRQSDYLREAVVITSYSIHYTKLYEPARWASTPATG